MSVNAVNLIREIRDRNYQITQPMTFEQRLEFIHKKAAEVEKRLNEKKSELAEEQE